MSFTFWFILVVIVVLIIVILKLLDRRNTVKMYNPRDAEKVESKKHSYFRHQVVEAKVRSLFPAHDSAEILQLLEAVPIFWGVERMKLNVLKLSGGNLDQLRHYISVACSERDFIEVINLAEYPESSLVPLTQIDKLPYGEVMGRLKRDTKQYLSWLQSK
jgi:hypothetical protein